MVSAARRHPSRRRVDPVRRVAVEVLSTWLRRPQHVEDLVERAEHDGPATTWSYVDRRRLREIVFGAVRLRGRYDHLVRELSDGTKSPPPPLRALLWAAMHELLAMRTPDHAVVDAYVEIARSQRLAWATGWVNAVLRRLTREPVEAFFPDPSDDPVGYAATWGSHPRWLVEAWYDRLGPAELLELCDADNERPAVHLRARPGHRDDLQAALAAHEWEARAVEFAPDALELITRVPPSVLLGAIQEPCTVQDAAAQLVAPLLARAVAPDARVLDLCAAPGGKTSHLAQLLGESARIVASDPDPKRLAQVRPTLARLGLTDRVALVAGDGARAAIGPGGFDGVLVDVPCTGTGVLSRRHDARWNRRPEDLVELPALQARLLETALDLVRPGGVVVYSTCSLEPEENDEVVDSVLARRDDVDEIGVAPDAPQAVCRGMRLQTWPHRHGLDGAFAARLRKREDGTR